MLPWSYTKIISLQTCPRQFYYRYVAKLPEHKTEETRIGLAIHEILANLLRTNLTFKQAFIHAAIHQQLSKESLKTITACKPYILTFVKNYKMRPFKAEYRFGLDKDFQPCQFFAPNVYFRGVCDLLVVDEVPEVLDFKTSTNTSNISMHYEKQLCLYSWAITKIFKLKKIQAKLFFVRSNVFQDVDVQNAETESLNLLATVKTVTTVADIPKPGAHCSYCSYGERCDAKHVE